jgi:hypothetical protein
MSPSTSYRLDAQLKRRLAEQAAAEEVTETALVGRLLDEGLKMAAFPGIVYRSGPTGRRAALANGPDVWEIILALRSAPGDAEAKVADAAEQLGLPERLIRLGLDFASTYPDEIRHRIELNDQAAERVREMAAERARLLAS